MTRVAVESPFAPPKGLEPEASRQASRENIRYALACLRYVLAKGASPYASHLLFTLVLRDTTPDERRLGMKAGFAYADECDERWIFVDLGVSAGMKAGETRGNKLGQRVQSIRIGDWRKLVADIPESVIDALVHVMVER